MGDPSPARGRSSRALLFALLAAFACDGYGGADEGSLVVSVRVEPSVQATTSFPAQVLVGFDSSGSGFVVFRVGFVCAPPSEPFVVTARFAERPSAVDAWVVPVGGTPGTCGALGTPEQVAAAPPAAAGVTTNADVTFFAGCGTGGTRTAALVLGG
jgi:hypothetical protein